MGKTTLLRVLAGQLPPSAGKRVVGHKVVLGYQSQEFSDTLPTDQSLVDIVRQAGGGDGKSVRTVLGMFGFSGDSVQKTCGVLSGGEKIRLSFARIFIRPPNFLLLDEPTTHLDMAGREALEAALGAYKGTVCLVSHDVEFVRSIADHVLEISETGLRAFAGGYDYYREKTAAEAPSAAPAARETSAQNPKEARRRRARDRQERSRETKRLKRLMHQAEKTVESLEAERGKLVERLSSAAGGTEFAEMNQRLTTIQEEVARQTRKWEDAALDLESLSGGPAPG
jgi:ATP-binding cassette subfamily F protein 3